MDPGAAVRCDRARVLRRDALQARPVLPAAARVLAPGAADNPVAEARHAAERPCHRVGDLGLRPLDADQRGQAVQRRLRASELARPAHGAGRPHRDQPHRRGRALPGRQRCRDRARAHAGQLVRQPLQGGRDLRALDVRRQPVPGRPRFLPDRLLRRGSAEIVRQRRDYDAEATSTTASKSLGWMWTKALEEWKVETLPAI